MKHFVFALMFWASCYFVGNAQSTNIPVQPGLVTQLRHLYAPLDKAQTATGLFFDYALPLVAPSRHRGMINDSNALNINTWGMLYGEMRLGHALPGANPLPEPSAYLDRIHRHHPDTVELALLAMRYDRLFPNAEELNLIAFQNGQYHDVPGRPYPPYNEDTLFAATLLRQTHKGFDPVIAFPSALLFKNLNWPVQAIFVDIADGQGWRELPRDGAVRAAYTSLGIKDVRIRYRAAGRWWMAHTPLEIKEPPVEQRGADYSRAPDESLYISGVKPYLGGVASAKVQFFYHCGNKKLRKPLIVVEGFEFKAFKVEKDYRDLLKYIDEPLWETEPNSLRDYLTGEGYDLVYVDLNNNVDYIQRNAFLLEEVIRIVNEKKAEAHSSEQNVVLGMSLGGLIGKYALLDMQASNLNHDTRLFMSYDSPLRGANIPIGVQCMVKFLKWNLDDLGGNISSIPLLNDALNVLNSPAPTQILLQQARYEYDYIDEKYYMKVGPGASTAFFAEMDGLGALDMRHVAISNGSSNGTFLENDFTAGGLLYNMDLTGHVCEKVKVPVLGWEITGCANLDIQMTIRATGNMTPTTVFLGLFKFDKVGIPNGTVKDEVGVNLTNPPYDVMPGSNSFLGLSGIVGLDNGLKTLVADYPSLSLTTSWPATIVRHHTFIPSFSSASTNMPTVFTGPQACGTPTLCSFPTQQHPNPNSYLFRSPPPAPQPGDEWNQDHIFLESRIGDLVREELKPVPFSFSFGEMPGTLSTYYNLGEKRYNKVKSINVIGASGKLSINNQGRLGFATGSEPFSALETFHAFTSCDAIVNIEPGATLAIGGDNNGRNGIFHIDGAQINIKLSGKIVIHNNSALIIGANSTLTLEPGAIIELRDNPDAGLVENGRARIKIEKGGKIIFGGDVAIIGDGCFEFDEGHIAVFPKDFTLIGAGKPYRFIKLNRAAVLEKTGGNLTLRNGTVEVGCSARISHKDGIASTVGQLRFKDGVTGCVPNPALDQIGLYCENGRMITVRDCEFRDVDYGMRTQGITFSAVVANTQFYNNYGLDLYKTRYATVTNIESQNSSFRFDDMSVGATLLNCTLTTGWATDLIMLKNVKMLTALGSNMDAGGGSYGINGLQGENNITLSNGSTIQNAIIGGVGLNGGVKGFKFSTDYGLLRMDCARILDCGFASVSGEDILLDIDALNISGGLRANEFRKGNFGLGEKFFDICYIKRNVPGNVVNARGNVWNVPSGIPAPSDYFMRKALVGGACDLGLPILLNAGNPAEGYDPSCRTECTDCFTTGHSDDRNNMCLLDGVNTKPVSDLAWKLYLESWVNAANTETEVNHSAALGMFGQVAEVDEVQMSASAPECQHLGLVSQVFVAPLGNGTRMAQNDLASGNLKLYPNPTSGGLVIEGPVSLYALFIHDSYGRLIYRDDATGTKSIDTAAWPSGIYLVELQGPSGRQRAKVVVQH